MGCQKFHNFLCASLSFTFDRTGNNEIGLLLAGSSEFPSLGTGNTLGIFYALGKAAILNYILELKSFCFNV